MTLLIKNDSRSIPCPNLAFNFTTYLIDKGWPLTSDLFVSGGGDVGLKGMLGQRATLQFTQAAVDLEVARLQKVQHQHRL